MSDPSNRIIVILGPTAGGKTALAVGLARKLGGQVIGADSMQVYRHLNAGTAKPNRRERAAAVHHLVDIIEPTESFTVADWLERAEALIGQLHAEQQWPIVVGGTNLYIRALLEGMFDGPPADSAFRATLADLTPQQMHEKLKGVDPVAAERIHPNDRKRIERALEVHHVTGRPISGMQGQWSEEGPGAKGLEPSPEDAVANTSPPPGGTDGGRSRTGGDAAHADESPNAYRHNPILIGLRWPVEKINRRINARVKRMFRPTDGSEDLVSETQRLRDAGLLGKQAAEALGTKQVLAYLNDQITLDDALERTKIETRRFAKSQRTWLKRFRGVHWLDADGADAAELIEQACGIVESV